MAKHSHRLVALIGAFKLIKAALLVALGLAALTVLPKHLGQFGERALAWMGVFPGRDMLQRACAKLFSLDDATARKLGLLSLAYAAIFLVEGLGLLWKKRWAEWMTVGVTASFIPLEIYEMFEHFGPGKIVALVLNVAIVVYLAWRRFEERRGFSDRVRHAVGAA